MPIDTAHTEKKKKNKYISRIKAITNAKFNEMNDCIHFENRFLKVLYIGKIGDID